MNDMCFSMHASLIATAHNWLHTSCTHMHTVTGGDSRQVATMVLETCLKSTFDMEEDCHSVGYHWRSDPARVEN